MKAKFAIFAILVLLYSAPWGSAESTVPKLMSYQGRVTDSAGTAIGNSAPVNRTVTFRLYSVSSGGTATYNETQTVTISGGEFSVLIGNGTGLTGLPGPTSPASPLKTLDTIVNTATTSALYLGITVDDGNSATVDAEISPRQQLVTGAYAMRSLMAETVASGAVTSAMLGDSSVTTNQLAANSINSAKISDASIAAADIASSAITAAKIDTSTIGLWTPSGTNIYRNSNVGIGVTNPEAVLQLSAKTGSTTPATNGLRVYNFNSTIADNAVLAAGVAGPLSGSPFVSLDISGTMGWSVGVDNADSDKLVFKTSWDFTANPRMAIDVAGNVGIGTTSPTEKLTVNGGCLRVTSASNPYVVVSSGSNQGVLAVATSAGSWSSSSSTNDVILKSDSSKVILQSGAGAAGIVIDTANKVGIGTSSPTEKLTIQDGKLWFNTAGSDNGGIGGTMASNDFFRIFGAGTSDMGALYIDTYDGANEPIIFRQVSGLPTGVNTPYERMRIADDGALCVSTTDSSQGSLNVGGALTSVGRRNSSVGYLKMTYDADQGGASFNVYNTGNGGTTSWRSFRYDGDSNLDYYSDESLKTQIVDSEPMLDRLMQLPFRRFLWKDNAGPGVAPEFGVIAQEVQPLFPDIVGKGTGGKLTVGYATFATIACKSIQELKVRVDDDLNGVQQQLDEKDERIADLEARLAALEKLIQGGN